MADSGFLLGIFFRGDKIHCYANFFCYGIVFGPNFEDRAKIYRGANCLRGRPLPPLWKKARTRSTYLQTLDFGNGLVLHHTPLGGGGVARKLLLNAIVQ